VPYDAIVCGDGAFGGHVPGVAGHAEAGGKRRQSVAFPLRAVLIAIFINLLWGGNPVGAKFALIAIPPLWSAFWRFLLGILCLVGWARVNRIRLWPKPGEWEGLLILGVFFAVQIGVANIGINMTTGSMAAVLIATNPIFAALYAHFFIPGDRMTVRKGAGLTLAFLGICFLFLENVGQIFGISTTWGNLVVLGSAAMLGGRVIFAARLLQRIDQTRVLFWQMIIALPLFALGGFTLEQVRWELLAWPSLAGIAYQGIVIAGFNFMVLAYLLRTYSPSVVISFNFLAPIAGVLLSIWLLGDQARWSLFAGLACVGLGLAMISWHRERRQDQGGSTPGASPVPADQGKGAEA
jgi:drug/metabolite transporter (DMT)-like permease